MGINIACYEIKNMRNIKKNRYVCTCSNCNNVVGIAQERVVDGKREIKFPQINNTCDKCGMILDWRKIDDI